MNGRTGFLAPRALRRLATAAAAVLASGCTSAAEREAEARMELGRAVFTELSLPRCTLCHTLVDAGANARVGPNLDQLKPDSQRVATAVAGGVGVMPAQADNLTPEQIGAVAFYVSRVTAQ